MFRLSLALAASAAAIITATATAPAFAQDSPTLRSILVADLSRDVDAFSEATRSEAKMIDSVPAEMPPLERLEKIGGTAQIEIGLNAKGDAHRRRSARVQRSCWLGVRRRRGR
jgi:hypothetical protein